MKALTDEQLVMTRLRQLTICRIAACFYHDFIAITQAFSWQLTTLFTLLALLQYIGKLKMAVNFWLPELLLLVMLVVSVLYASVMAWLHPTGLLATARDLDQRYGLNDLIGTACAVVHRQDQSAAARTVVHCASPYLQAISARKYLPLSWDKRLGSIGLLVLSAMLVIWPLRYGATAGTDVSLRHFAEGSARNNKPSAVDSRQKRKGAKTHRPTNTATPAKNNRLTLPVNSTQTAISASQKSTKSISSDPRQANANQRKQKDGKQRTKMPSNNTISSGNPSPGQPGESSKTKGRSQLGKNGFQRPGDQQHAARSKKQPGSSGRPKQRNQSESPSAAGSKKVFNHSPKLSKKSEKQRGQQKASRNLELAKNHKTHKGDLDPDQQKMGQNSAKKNSARADSRPSTPPRPASQQRQPDPARKKSTDSASRPQPGKRPRATGAKNNDSHKSEVAKPVPNNHSGKQASGKNDFIGHFIKPLFGEGSKWITQRTLEIQNSQVKQHSDKKPESDSRHYRFARQAENYIRQNNIPEDYREGVKRYFQLVRPAK